MRLRNEPLNHWLKGRTPRNQRQGSSRTCCFGLLLFPIEQGNPAVAEKLANWTPIDIEPAARGGYQDPDSVDDVLRNHTNGMTLNLQVQCKRQDPRVRVFSGLLASTTSPATLMTLERWLYPASKGCWRSPRTPGAQAPGR